ncbi:uncharacterized protein LOC113228604 [Hyposmocoma kahamanoa]|uniref:uncharacterized protein LOC113228604 n=1 Tax=Hyposmocoma kahamanoa TaxID=1477025 RepID=UPI000E6D6F3C|nr:uncharacterized protein LOC113228604 [Hyposmocoma kahamanoa]
MYGASPMESLELDLLNRQKSVVEGLFPEPQRFTPPALHLMDDCLRTGLFPRCWKEGRLILVPKPGRPADSPSGFRPLVLLDENATSGFVSIKLGVRQRHTISPNFFTSVLEEMMKTHNWDEKGVYVNGRRMSHLRFADDLILMAGNFADLQTMLQDLHEAPLTFGVEMTRPRCWVLGPEGWI